MQRIPWKGRRGLRRGRAILRGVPMLLTLLLLPLFLLPLLGSKLPASPAPDQQARLHTFGDRSRDRGVHIAPLDDGAFAVTGIWQEEGRGDDDVLLAVVEATGEVRWRVAHGGARRDWGWCVIPLSGGGFFVVGTTASSGAGLHDMMLLRADPGGGQIWRRAYGGAGEEHAWSGRLMPDGGVVMVGETTTGSAGERDAYLVRVDAEGEPLWERRWGGEGEDRLFSVAGGERGELFAVGLTTSRGAGAEDALLMTFTASGEILRADTRGEETLDVAHHIAPIPDGFLVTGFTESYGAIAQDPWLMELDGEGRVTGQHVVRLSGINRTLTGCLTGEGYFALTGFGLDAQERSTVLTLRVDRDGSSAQPEEYARSENSLGYTVCAAPDGGFAVTGHAEVPDRGLQVVFLRYPAR